MPALAQPRLTVAEFLEWDSGDERRFELIDGVPVAMATPRRAHRILAANLARRFGEALDDRPPCSAGVEEAIAVPGRDDLCHVADVAVTCEPHEPGQRLTPEPLVVVEVLSPTTENDDRKVKLPNYQTIPSVQAIVLIDPERLHCEVYHRQKDGRWLVDLLRTPEARLQIPGIGFDQPLSVLYDRVRLPE